MALLLLQPGIEPLGQFDIDDTDNVLAGVAGGEVGVLGVRAAGAGLPLDDFCAADVGDPLHAGTRMGLMVDLDSVGADTGAGASTGTTVYGLVDEGSTGYGTLFGTVIGGTAGQGTGLGNLPNTGAVVVGPITSLASGKVTLWSKPGLYGVTQPAFLAANADGAAVNDALFGTATGTGVGSDGKLVCNGLGGTGIAGQTVGIYLGATADRSLVSTTNTAAGIAPATEYHTMYLYGPTSLS